jgi:ubiquinone/menaquinone biosynthesis C-methylase UbiE
MRGDIEEWLEEKGEKAFKKIGIKKGYVILDFGCGSGNYAIPAAKVVGKKGKVYALDKDETDLNKLMQRAKSVGLENIERIKTSGGLKIPLKDESVDVVLLYDVLHIYYFSSSEREQLLREVYRVLKPHSLLSVYPKHMGLEEIKRGIENVNFYLESKHFKTLIHDGRYTEGYILNFRKADKKQGLGR